MKYAIILLSILALSACTSQIQITNFEECIAAGNPAMESYPRQCNDGTNTWIEEIELTWENDDIILMKNSEDGSYACFGCSQLSDGKAICVDPAEIMIPAKETPEMYCNNDFEIIKVKTLGDTCQTSNECMVPFEYAVMSNCPYGTACIENKCAVVCPITYHDPDGASESYSYTCKEDTDCNCEERGDRTIDCSCIDNACVSVEAKEKEDLPMKPCTKEYRPVCGEVEIQCVTTPCDPIKTTFSNKCEAENAGATNIIEDECSEEVNLEGACLSFDGTWLEESQECEGMSKNMCENLGGTFNECASACRNNPEAEICTLQCVQVCSFK